MQKFSRLAYACCAGLLLSNCTACSHLGFPGVYKIEVAQGNQIEEAQLKQLKPGMTEKQVMYLLGSPLIQDPLQPHRWDYYQSIQPSGHGKPQVKHWVVYFKEGVFSHYGENPSFLLK